MNPYEAPQHCDSDGHSPLGWVVSGATWVLTLAFVIVLASPIALLMILFLPSLACGIFSGAGATLIEVSLVAMRTRSWAAVKLYMDGEPLSRFPGNAFLAGSIAGMSLLPMHWMNLLQQISRNLQ